MRKLWQQWQGMLMFHLCFFGFLFAPFLTGRRLVGGSADAALIIYSFMQLFDTRAYSPDLLWNDLNFHGFPTFLGVAYPLHPLLGLLTLMGSAITAMNWTIFLHVLLGAFFFSLLMKQEGVSPWGNLVAGIAYVAAMRSWFFDITLTGILPLFPLLLLSIRYTTKAPVKAMIGGSVITAIAWLTLHFHFTLIFLTGAGLYAIMHAWRQRTHTRTIIGTCIAMVLLGTAVGMIRLLPALAYVLLSFRADMSLTYVMDRGLGSRYPLLYLFPHFPFPFLTGGADFSPYVGPLIFACILVGIIHNWHARRTRVLLCIYLVTLTIAMRNSPLYALLYHIPPFTFLRSPTRWPLLGAFALAALAGIGFDTLMTEDTTRCRKILSWIFLGTGAAAAIGGMTFSLLPLALTHAPLLEKVLSSIAHSMGYGQHAGEHVAAIAATNYGLHTMQLALPTLAITVAGIVLHPRAWKRISPHHRPKIFALVSTITLLIVLFPTQLVQGKSAAIFTTTTRIQEFLAHEGGLFLSFLPGSAERALLQTGTYKATLAEIQQAELSFLPANENLFHLLPSADYYDRLGSKRMGRLLALVGADRPSVAPEEILANAPLTSEEKMQELQKRRYMLDILNVRHVISGWPLETVGFTKTFTEEVTDARIPVSVYENPSPRPFAYFVKRAEFMEPDQNTAFQRLRDRTWDSDDTLIECRNCQGTTSFTANGSIEIIRHSPTFLEIETTSNEAQWLVLSQNFLPGWHVLIDGQRITPGLAMSTFAAIPLTEGKHRVTLTFTMKNLLWDSWLLVIWNYPPIWL